MLRAYPKIEHLKGHSGKFPHKARLERLAMDKHSSLLQKCINYIHEKFVYIRLWLEKFSVPNALAYSASLSVPKQKCFVEMVPRTFPERNNPEHKNP
jgi:hypothetical protein